MHHTGIVETSPIVVNGVMYITEPPSTATALDLRTGRPLWTYTPNIPKDVIIIGSPPVNRGVAVLDNMVYYGTVNCHLVALDAKTWNRPLGHQGGRKQERLLHHCRAAGRGG